MTTSPVSSRCSAPVSTYVETRSENPLPAWKRGLDISILIFTAPITVPLMLVIAALIKILSPGPVFFRQERIGYKGRPFTCFKFRTMKAAAETSSHEAHLQQLVTSSDTPMKKLDDVDTRIIPVFGPILRASGLDELAQIFNVMNKEMSFVGPRPCIRYEYEKFGLRERARFDCLPGLTGLWQVSGKNNLTFKQMIDLDVAYAHNLSFGRDLSIVFRTFPVLFDQIAQLARRKMSRLAKATCN